MKAKINLIHPHSVPIGAHEFSLFVKGTSRKSAERAILLAFSLRQPDGCEFYLRNKAKPFVYTDATKLANALAGISRVICECGLGSVKLGELSAAMLKLRPAKKTVK